LLPIGGVSRLEHIPEKPREEFLVSVAGPAVNVVISVLLIVFAGAKLDMGSLTTIENTSQGLINQLAMVNLFLAVFNLIPAFPMDGGRVFRALLATRFGYVRATEIAAATGQLVAFALGFVGLFGDPLLIFIAIFIYLGAAAEAHVVAIRAVARGVPVTAAMLTDFTTLTPDEHVDKAVETALHTSQGEFPVVDGMGRPIGLLARNDLIRSLKDRGPAASVADTMTRDVPTVNNRRCLDEAFRLLQEKSAPAVAVVDASGKLVGLVTSETIGQMMMLHQKQPPGTQIGPWSRAAR
jgi:CBS domain-containing protein